MTTMVNKRAPAPVGSSGGLTGWAAYWAKHKDKSTEGRSAAAWKVTSSMNANPTTTPKEHLDHAVNHARLAVEHANSGDFSMAARHMAAARDHRDASKATAEVVKMDTAEYDTLVRDYHIAAKLGFASILKTGKVGLQ